MLARRTTMTTANTSGDPVPAIPEANATGDVAKIYADIRATQQAPVVNLIWRHLATFPNGLAWAWESLKPLYHSNSIRAEAAALRASVQPPALKGLSPAALTSAELSASDLAHIAMILHTYERSNATNMIALGTLLNRLNGTPSDANATPVPDTPPYQPEAPIDGEMPTLLTLDAMAPSVAALVQDLNRIGARDEILASMYRHLAHWPAYLTLVHTVIAPFGVDDELEQLIKNVTANAQTRAARLNAQLADPTRTLSPKVKDQLGAALAEFFHGPICKMVTIVPLIRRAMPG
jgi:hypothetical protein